MIVNIYGVPSQNIVRWIVKKMGKISTWIDLGCGNGEYLSSIEITPKKGIAVDISQKIPLLPQNFIFKNQNTVEWLKENNNQKYTLLTMFDLIEHFPKHKAINFIDSAGRLTDFLLITTPSGFLRQDSETHPEFANNHYLWHRSGFSPKDFESKGFLVFVLKNYHYKPTGNDRSFDKLVCFWARNQLQYSLLSRLIRIKNIIYLLWPLHFYRMMRDVFSREWLAP